MNLIILLIFLFYLVFCPFYMFDSGYPQPVDILLTIGILLFLIRVKFDFFKRIPIRNLIYFVSIVLIVSIVNQVIIYFGDQQGNTLYPALYYIFNFLVFSLLIYVSGKFDKQYFFNLIGIALVITVVLQFSLSLFGIQHNDSSWVKRGLRVIVFFNNPNQLGYFALLIYTMFIVVPSKLRQNKQVVFAMALMTINIAVLSMSRSAILGLLVLNALLLLKELLKYKLKNIIYLVLLFIGSLWMVGKTNYIVSKVDDLQERIEKKNSSFEKELNIRGYERISKYPEYLFFGAAEGAVNRFDLETNNEIHSGFGTILFSYGFLGFILFLLFLFEVIKSNLLNNMLVLIPIFIQNLFHQGFRNTLFWVLLALIYIVSEKNIKRKSIC